MRHGTFFATAGLLAILACAKRADAEPTTDANGVGLSPGNEVRSALSTRGERLNLTLERLAEAQHWSATKTVGQFALGTVFVGLAGYFAFSRNVQQGTGSSRGAAVILSMMTGAAYFGRGVYALGGVTTSHEARLARFRALREKQALGEVDLARFEGELATEAELARSARHWEGAASLGIAVGGAGVITLAATSELRKTAREISYIEGGVMLLSGAGAGLYSLLTESPSEREWRTYREGATTSEHARAPRREQSESPRDSFRCQLSPALAPGAAGLSLVGQF